MSKALFKDIYIVLFCRLWHQTTLLLLEVIKHPSLQKNDELLKLYRNFVADFENK